MNRIQELHEDDNQLSSDDNKGDEVFLRDFWQQNSVRIDDHIDNVKTILSQAKKVFYFSIIFMSFNFYS